MDPQPITIKGSQYLGMTGTWQVIPFGGGEYVSIASYKTVLNAISDIDSFTDEPMTAVTGDDKIHFITDRTKSRWDPETIPTFKADGVDVDEADIEHVDMLFGIVIFTVDKVNVTVSGEYVSVLPVVYANSYTLNTNTTVLDKTGFKEAKDNDGYRLRKTGLLEASMNISGFHDMTEDFATEFDELIASRKPFFIEVIPGGDYQRFRGWFVCETDNLSGGVDDLEGQELSFQSVTHKYTSFAWGVETAEVP